MTLLEPTSIFFDFSDLVAITFLAFFLALSTRVDCLKLFLGICFVISSVETVSNYNELIATHDANLFFLTQNCETFTNLDPCFQRDGVGELIDNEIERYSNFKLTLFEPRQLIEMKKRYIVYKGENRNDRVLAMCKCLV